MNISETHKTKYIDLPYCDPSILFKFLEKKNASIFLDSSLNHKKYGRYSFIVFDPFMFFQANNKNINIYDFKYDMSDNLLINKHIKTGNPFDILKDYLQKFSLKKIDKLPPFQGGACGYFGYELLQHLENIPVADNHMKVPDMAIGFYNFVISFDNIQKKSWLVYSDLICEDKLTRIKNKIILLINKILNSDKNKSDIKSNIKANFDFNFDLNHVLNYKSNFDCLSYKNAVKTGINKILAGDIFEVNLSQQFEFNKINYNKYNLYLKMREINPAPFSAYLNFSHLDQAVYLLSNSPERFLKLDNNKVETKPIKGTIRRDIDKAKDLKQANFLLNSKKDIAENIMIVDLMRNDLTKVCKLHSVKVPELCALESYAGVHHLVSTVIGLLKSGLCAMDLIKASFPGGSITGAPKVEAMKIINQIEGVRRGPYCGSIGYISFNGDMDISIAIRTLIINASNLGFLQAGGAVTTKSDPESEYQESLDKINKILKVLLSKNITNKDIKLEIS